MTRMKSARGLKFIDIVRAGLEVLGDEPYTEDRHDYYFHKVEDVDPVVKKDPYSCPSCVVATGLVALGFHHGRVRKRGGPDYDKTWPERNIRIYEEALIVSVLQEAGLEKINIRFQNDVIAALTTDDLAPEEVLEMAEEAVRRTAEE